MNPLDSELVMTRFIKAFFKNDSGAVTVDWVVLTAAMVGLAGGLGATVMNATTAASVTVSDSVTTKTVSNGD